MLLPILLLIAAGARSEAEPVPSSTLFPVTEARLTNGLRLLTVEDRHNPLVAVQVWYHVGSVDEPVGRHGFAHLFEHMMFRGTDRLGPTDHFDLVHRVGGSCNAFTAFDETCYHETLPAEQLELALWLESERMAFLTVDGPGFTTERKVVEEERRMALNLPYGDLADQGPPLVFGRHPYGHDPLGTFHDLRAATPADVHAWWTQRYTPNNATLVIVGGIDAAKARALCERYFGWIPSVPPMDRNVPRLTAWEKPETLTLNLANAPAPVVALVWRTVPEGHPDALALDLLATILGGDATATIRGGANSSRLYRRLVVEDRLAVMATAMQYGLARAGLFGAGAALSPLGGDTARTLSGLRAELERVRREGVTEDEIEKARNQALMELVRGAQTAQGKADLIGRAVVVGAGLDELNTRVDRLRRLTREDLLKVARAYLDPEYAHAITVPGSSLWNQLSRLFFGQRKAEEAAPTAIAPDATLRGRPGVARPPDLPVRPPTSETHRQIDFPSVQEHRLTNGLRVLIVPRTNTALVHAVLALPGGSSSETKPGAAAMALTLLAKGTTHHDEQAFAEALDRCGIRLSGFAGYDDSRVQATCLQEHAERALTLLAEAVTQPAFPERPFKTAISQTTTELRISDTAPAAVADRELRRHLFPAHPYGRRVSGEASDLAGLRLEDVRAFWRQVAQPATATLVIAGALTDQQGLALAERALGGWRAAEASAAAAPPPPASPATTSILLVDWSGAGQSQIAIGGLGIANRDPDKPLANLVGSYFGGTFGSRLMKAIRVQKGATYGASGGFNSSRFAGTFTVQTFTKTASTADIVRTALAEIRDVRERPPGAEELTLHKRHFLGGATARFQTPEQVASQIAYLSVNDLPLDHWQRSLARIESAGADQCEAFARRVVDAQHLVIVVVGDAAVIAKDLAAIAPVTVLDREGQPVKPAAPVP